MKTEHISASPECREHDHAHGPGQDGHSLEDSHHVHGHCHAHDHEHPSPAPQARTKETILTVRALSGLSGDMMLGGLAAMAELDQKRLAALIGELNIPALAGSLALEERSVNAVRGWGCRVSLPEEHVHRTLADIEILIRDSALPEEAKLLSTKAFRILAEAEAAVHGQAVDAVAFHEVGALDSILDTCLVCRIFGIIKPDRFICSPLPLADGVIRCAHGLVSSPAPAVARLLPGVPVRAFSGEGETVTPTALSLLKALGAEFGPWPSMTVRATAISYGSKVFLNAPNGALWALGQG